MNPEVVLKIDAINNAQAALDQAKKQLEAVQGQVAKAEKQTKSFNDRIKGLQPTFRRMAAVGAGAFAGLAVGISKSVDAASRASDIENLFNIAFDNTQDRMNKFVTDFSKEFGRAETNIRQQAQNIGFAIQMGTSLGEEASADMAQEQIKVAEALAFTYDHIQDGEQAMQAITNAFNGNADSLRQLVPTIREANIQEKALEMGLADTKEEVDANIRAQALHQLILDGTRGSVEALEGAEGTYADTKARVAAQTQNLSETLGKTFLPIAQQLLEKITPIIERITNWVSENEELTKKIIIGAAAIAGIVAVVGTLGMVLLPVIAAFKIAAVVIALIASPIGIIIGLLAIIGASIAYLALNWAQHWDNIKWALGNVVDWIGAKLEGAKNMLRGFGNFFIGIAEGIANSWVSAINTIIEALNRIQISIPDWVPGLGGKSFGINLPKLDKVEIPRLADGGIVTRSILANVGEAGPEAVIPLDRMAAMGGPNVTINISGTFMDDRAAARRMGDEVMRALKREMKLS